MTRDSDRPALVLRFTRAVSFPRFRMCVGELWASYEHVGAGRAYLDAVAAGDSAFSFAGGQCLVADVEIARRGPAKECWRFERPVES